jgi:hypothetical protein
MVKCGPKGTCASFSLLVMENEDLGLWLGG